MHYFIDGYNLLFRLMHTSDNLQQMRQEIILDLNKKIALVKIDVSIVFDGTFQLGEGSRSHFNQIEILFTAAGETADEFIIDELKNIAHPQQETVVTSDKKLAWRARRRLAQTESVEEFMGWLNKSYKNKLKQQRKPQIPPLTKSKPAFPPSEIPQPIEIRLKKLEGSQEYYEQFFETRYQELIKQEKSFKEEKKSKPASKKKIRRKDPFQDAAPQPVDAATEMERWLKVFEKRLDHPDSSSKY